MAVEVMDTLSVVVPVYFNAPSLPELYQRLLSLSERDPSLQLKIFFVDDGSGDDSYKVIQELVKLDPRVVGIKLSRNFGAFNACLAGLTRAQGDCTAIISADLQDPPELLADMVAKWRAGAKVVLAVRQRREDGRLKAIFANLYYWLFRLMIAKDMPKGGFDFVLVDKIVVQSLCSMREKNTTLMGLILWTGFSRELVYYVRRQRKHGKSRWTVGKKIDYFIDSFLAFSKKPLRFFSLFGVAASLLAFLGILYVLLASLFGWMNVAGWPSLMVVILFMFGITLTGMGIIGEYVWRALEEARSRPPFLVEEEVRSDGLAPGEATCP